MDQTKNRFWNSAWEPLVQRRVAVSHTDSRIINEIVKSIDIQGKTVIELGCGRGVLSRCLLQHKAHKATLVDFSEKAITLAKSTLSEYRNVDFIFSDIFDLDEKQQYDIVFSAGLAEHFSGNLREKCIMKHLSLSKNLVVIITPARPHFNSFRHKKKRVKAQYGWQRAFSKQEMKTLVEKSGPFRVIVNKRFYPSYAVDLCELLNFGAHTATFEWWDFPFLVVNRFLHRIKFYLLVDRILSIMDNTLGGLLITIAHRT